VVLNNFNGSSYTLFNFRM